MKKTRAVREELENLVAEHHLHDVVESKAEVCRLCGYEESYIAKRDDKLCLQCADNAAMKKELKQASKVIQLMRMRFSGRKLLRLIENDLEANGLYDAYLEFVWSSKYQ